MVIITMVVLLDMFQCAAVFVCKHQLLKGKVKPT